MTALWADARIQNALALCDARGAFLFEVIPHLVPWGRLTDIETQLWVRFYEERKARK